MVHYYEASVKALEDGQFFKIMDCRRQWKPERVKAEKLQEDDATPVEHASEDSG